MRKYLTIALMLAVAAFASVSCNKEENVPPTVPSVETLRIDFSKVPLKQATKADDIDHTFTENISRINSIIYSIWDDIYTRIVNIPVGSFDVICKAEPVQDGKGNWIWESNYRNWGQTYTVRLIGTVRGKKVDWELQVSRDGIGGFENYTWITGWSYRDGHAGSWKINVNPYDFLSKTDVLVTTDWTAGNDGVSGVKITYSLDHKYGSISEFFNGSTVEYIHAATDKAYDSTLALHYGQNVAGLNVNAVIEWNSRTGACRINSNVFSDSEWHTYRK